MNETFSPPADASTADTRRAPLLPRWLLAAVCLVLAFGFLDARGIWDPDEGRYTNIALTMLDRGEWLTPMRNLETGHWTKPPGAYWLIAASVSAFGETAWAARLPIALSYLACVLLAAGCARRLAPGSGRLAALIYATCLLPAGAAQLITADYPLAAAQALAMYAFVRYRFADAGASAAARGAWLPAMWAAFALGFMIKGPPALLPLLAVAALGALAPGPGGAWRWHALGAALFAALALPWYLTMGLRHEGLMEYFLGAEVVDRVASDRFGRHPEWYGWLKIYLPTLLLGTLPWTGELLRWARALPARALAWRARQARVGEAGALFLALWIALPLLVFCLAQSRLPLYLLPTFLPLAVAMAATRHARGRGVPDLRWLLLWALLLLGLRYAAAQWDTHKDASEWAQAIRARSAAPVEEVLFVEDMARYGLRLHLGAEVEKLSRQPREQPRFNPEYDEPLRRELEHAGDAPGSVFVAKQALWPPLRRQIAGYGYRAQALGAPYRGRVIFRVERAPPAAPSPTRE
ncbi:ArnT family glycosyltransferase [Lysobacter enzymogenes]|uniref:ArnT family glycosyltransferase n=1 Tax=Lysobacter enzymogenes TaxID=69 RepID=UPI000897580F|nr:glycosyltransferase family 39 protein [Lysobacter enzymogenes]SDX98061.1 Dolichyl-phosphate-mannose-protein mannosyltransferase [Lysobacter enzymogenes]